jgi:hypothetical protein
LLEVNFAGLQGVEHQIRCHQLGQRRRLDRHVRVFGRQNLVGGDIDQQISLGRDLGWLRHLRLSAQSQGSQKAKASFFNEIVMRVFTVWTRSAARRRGSGTKVPATKVLRRAIVRERNAQPPESP